MKRIFLLLLVVSLVFGISCSDDDEGYYITFKANNVEKEFNYGFGEEQYGIVPFANYIDGGSYTEIFGTAILEYESNGSFNDYIIFSLDNTSTMTGIYNETNAWMDYAENDISFNDENFIVNVTKYEDVGGVVEGTFSGTFVLGGTNTNIITDGKFRVLRLSNNTYSFK